MDFTNVAFYIFAALTVCSAGIMVFHRNVVYSAVGLLFAFFGVAGIYVLLAADFIAIVQILIYVGGILILLLFGVMLSQKITKVDLRSESMQLTPAVIVVGGVLAVLLMAIRSTPWKLTSSLTFEPTTKAIGRLMMTEYLIPFEIASVLLLAALIGAAYIARKN